MIKRLRPPIAGVNMPKRQPSVRKKSQEPVPRCTPMPVWLPWASQKFPRSPSSRRVPPLGRTI